MSAAKELGKIFRDVREKKGLSVEETSRKSRIHSNVIKDIESGVFDRLNKVYTKSFLKKYAAFLKLDTDDILKRYEKISSGIPEQEQKYVIEEEERKKTASLAIDDKRFQAILVGVLSFVLVILIFVLVGKIKTKFTAGEPKKVTAVSRKTAQAERKPARSSGKTASTAAAKKPDTKTYTAPARREVSKFAPVVLTLRAEGDVWVKVAEGEEALYIGTLHDGESKTWKSSGELTVWTGKAENLVFVVNTRRLGVVAFGVVKNIIVSSEGVRIGDRWVSRL